MFDVEKIKLLYVSKKLISDNADLIVKDADNGFTCPVELDIKLKVISDICNEARAKIKNLVIDNVRYAKYSSKHNVKVELNNGYDVLDYEQDEEYAKISEMLKRRKELLDIAYKNRDKISTVANESGEVIPKIGVKYSVGECVKYKIEK